MAVVGVSLRTRISGVGFVSPLSIDATYCAMRITPCESWPRRFARTSSAAIHAASDSGTPRALKMRLARASRSSALTMGMVALPLSQGRNQAARVLEPVGERERSLGRSRSGGEEALDGAL